MEQDLNGNSEGSLRSTLEKIDFVTYQLLGSLLFEIVPQFQQCFQTDGNGDLFGGYAFFNDFALELSKQINIDSGSPFVRNSFDYINGLSESNNQEVLNILKIGILEILYTSDGIVRSRTRDFLSQKNQRMFMAFSNFYS